MNFSFLPEELVFKLLDQLNCEYKYSQQVVMLFINKRCCDFTIKWFKEKCSDCDGTAYQKGLKNLLPWACSIKRRKPYLVQWAETFGPKFTRQCCIEALKNKDINLIKYIFQKWTPNTSFLGDALLHGDKKIYQFFLDNGKTLQSKPNIPWFLELRVS